MIQEAKLRCPGFVIKQSPISAVEFHSDLLGAFFPFDFVLLLLVALTGGSEVSWAKVAIILPQFSWICLYTK